MRQPFFFVPGGLLGLLTLISAPAQAQTPANPTQPWGSWFIGTVQLPGSADKRWGGFAEAQARTNAVFRQYFYHELKGGVNFAPFLCV